jgi:hypothetical protein
MSISASSAALGRRWPARARGRGFGQLIGQVQRRQHGDALARLDLAAVADVGHFLVDTAPPPGRQQRLAALGAAQDVAMAHDGDFDLLQGRLRRGCRSAGSRASSASMRRALRPGATSGCRARPSRLQLLLHQRTGALEFLVPAAPGVRPARRGRAACSSEPGQGEGSIVGASPGADPAGELRAWRHQARTVQRPHCGLRAWQTWRPCRINQWCASCR